MTTIWETRSSLQEHPLLQVAISIVLENIENCSSRSYDVGASKDATDHKNVLMNLPGRFHLKHLDNIMGQTTGEADLGIAFNRALVNHSTKYV